MRIIQYKLRKAFLIINQSIIYAWKKAIKYPANFISWVLADIGMYFSVLLMYLFIETTASNMAGYNIMEANFFISFSFIVNCLFATFFSEASDILSSDIWNGEVIYNILKPYSLITTYMIKNINIKSLVSFPFLLIINIYFLYQNKMKICVMYFLCLIIAVIDMGLLFFVLSSLNFAGFHSNSLNPYTTQLLNLRERPDSVFQKKVRSFFTYIIPVYLTSSVPVNIILNKVSDNKIVSIWFFLSPFIFSFVTHIVFIIMMKYYKGQIEG